MHFDTDQDVMRHALELAARGVGLVEPNPPVGAVIVDADRRLLGAGWHQRFGGPHAEVHAIEAAGELARGATLFVTLEPCCHFGKTPPCSRAVIAAGLKRVVVAMSDPAAHVNGGGIQELLAAGVTVEVGLLEAEARRLTAPFVQLMTLGRPWVHAKWAMTLDGKLATRTGHSQWISSPESREAVHRLRGRMDAILVGIGTAVADDPLLTARPAGPRIATRIVLDPQARLPLTSQLVTTARQVPVVVIATVDAPPQQVAALERHGVEVWRFPGDDQRRIAPDSWLAEMGRRRWTHVLIEGGGGLLGSLNDADRLDELHVLVAPKLVGGATAITPVAGLGLAKIPSLVWGAPTYQPLGPDLYIHLRRDGDASALTRSGAAAARRV